jgi:hypothetical protein
MGEWRYNSTILSLVTRWRWVVSFMPLPLYSQYPLYRRLVGPRAGLDVMEEKNRLPLLGIELQLLSCPACNLVALPTELPQLHIIFTILNLKQFFTIHWSVDCWLQFSFVSSQTLITIESSNMLMIFENKLVSNANIWLILRPQTTKTSGIHKKIFFSPFNGSSYRNHPYIFFVWLTYQCFLALYMQKPGKWVDSLVDYRPKTMHSCMCYSASNRNEYQESSWGWRVAGA